MSTRLGVKRSAEVVAAAARTGADGRTYYDIQVGRRTKGGSCQCLSQHPQRSSRAGGAARSALWGSSSLPPYQIMPW